MNLALGEWTEFQQVEISDNKILVESMDALIQESLVARISLE